MRRTKYFTPILIACCLSIIVLGGQQKKASLVKPRSVAEAVERVNPSIVQIKLKIEQESVKKNEPPKLLDGKGTGFWVSEDGYVITARHVVRPKSGKVKELAVALPIPPIDKPAMMRGIFQVARASIVAEDIPNDLALLKPEINPFREKVAPMMKIGHQEIRYEKYACVQLDPKRPKEGTQIITTGYPFDIPVPVTNVGHLATAWETNSETLRSLTLSVAEIGNAYLADLRVNLGNSGGPIYSAETGYVIGVCVAFKQAGLQAATLNGPQQVYLDGAPLVYNSGISYVVPIEYAIKLLKQVNASHIALAKKQ